MTNSIFVLLLLTCTLADQSLHNQDVLPAKDEVQLTVDVKKDVNHDEVLLKTKEDSHSHVHHSVGSGSGQSHEPEEHASSLRPYRPNRTSALPTTQVEASPSSAPDASLAPSEPEPTEFSVDVPEPAVSTELPVAVPNFVSQLEALLRAYDSDEHDVYEHMGFFGDRHVPKNAWANLQRPESQPKVQEREVKEEKKPEVKELEVMPEIGYPEVPDIKEPELPESKPEVKKAEVPEITETEVPKVKVQTEFPEVKVTDVPEVKETEVSKVKKIEVPEVMEPEMLELRTDVKQSRVPEPKPEVKEAEVPEPKPEVEMPEVPEPTPEVKNPDPEHAESEMNDTITAETATLSCNPGTSCLVDSDCHSGRCLGLAVGKCNCGACVTFTPCTKDKHCGGLVGACDHSVMYCNCEKGFAFHGKTVLDVLFNFCNRRECEPQTNACFGLPCNYGVCAC